MDRAQLHQRSHAQGVAGVLREHQEGGAVGLEAAVQLDAVHDGGHAELAHAVVDVVAGEVALGQALGAGPDGQIGAGQVGGAAHEFRQQRAVAVQAVLGRLAAGHFLGLGIGLGDEGVGLLVPVGGQFAGHAALELGGLGRIGFAVGGELLVPGGLGGGTLLLGIPAGGDLAGDLERRMVPAQGLAGQGNIVVTQGGAVAVLQALLVGGAEADDGLAADQGRLVGDRAGLVDGGLDGVAVVTVHLGDNVPTVGLEAGRGVVGEPGRGLFATAHLTVDGDVVVVVEGGQLAQTQGTGQGAGLVGDALHQAAVAQKGIGVVVDDVVAGLVELGGQGLFGDGHADGVGDALAQGTGGGLHARRIAVFGVSGGLGVQLTEILQVVDGQIVPGQMQQGVDQHGAVAVGEDEAVTVGPLGVGRVVLHVVVPQNLGDIGHAHGRARMTGVGFLDRVHAQGTDRIGELSA